MVKISYNEARLVLSAPSLSQCPQDSGGEVAFAGYSNVGKSSVINAITGVHGLARASKIPGRTRLLNFFSLAPGRRLVDLPGYGFARVAAQMQQQWEETMADYFENRRSLLGLMIIMDIRHPLKQMDMVLLDWCQKAGIPARVLLNKADKMSRPAANKVLQQTTSRLGAMVTVQLFSAHKGTGVNEARQWLERLFKHGTRP